MEDVHLTSLKTPETSLVFICDELVTILKSSLCLCHSLWSVTKCVFSSQMCLQSVTNNESSWMWIQSVTMPFGHAWNIIFFVISRPTIVLTTPLTAFVLCDDPVTSLSVLFCCHYRPFGIVRTALEANVADGTNADMAADTNTDVAVTWQWCHHFGIVTKCMV
jgi:hypothetical protein